MSIKIFIYELEGQEPIISLTDKSTTRFKFTDEEIDFNNDGKINEQSGEKFRSITINGNILLGHILNKTEISKEAEEVKCLINWALLPGDDEKCYKRIEIREIDELNDMGGNDELIEEIEYAYVADYKEHYNLTAGKNSGLVPFEIIIKERVNIGDESLSNIIPTVDNSGSNEINDNKDLNQDNNLNFSDSTYRVSTLVENLKVGSKGEQVKQLQKRLNELCKENLVVDGDFGTNTKHAVDRFKQQYGLGNSGENAGVVGEQTWKLLLSRKFLNIS